MSEFPALQFTNNDTKQPNLSSYTPFKFRVISSNKFKPYKIKQTAMHRDYLYMQTLLHYDYNCYMYIFYTDFW